MKIDLQTPFSKDYKAGYLLQNKEPRKLVILVNFNNTRKTISYARYLMSCHIGRYLSDNEQVDHIDNNPLNDIIENLQILSQIDNIKKSLAHRNISKRYEMFICPVCNKKFSVPYNQVVSKFSKDSNYKPCCSRSCGGKKSHW